MDLRDSMFLFEIIVEELKSFINCREFWIRGQFADVFSVHLKDPNEVDWFLPKRPGKLKSKRKTKTKNSGGPETSSSTAAVQTGQTVLFATNVDTLISNMKQYPLELSLWRKVAPDYKIGSTRIPWSAPYYEYLNKLHRKQGQQPICVRGDYNVFDEITSKRMAVIKLNIKLSHLNDKITTQFRSISRETQQTDMNTGLNSKPVSALSRMIIDRPINLTEETGTIKTIYNDDKRRPIRTKKRNVKKKETKSIDNLSSKERVKRVTEVESAEVGSKINNRTLNSRIITLVRSDRNLDKNPTLSVIRSKSCSSIDVRNSNILNKYIFGDTLAGPFGKQVYCVSYFTVKNDFADSPTGKSASPKSVTPSSPSPKSSSPSTKSEKPVIVASDNSKSEKSDELQEKEKFKIRICESECANVKRKSGLPGTQSTCSLDLPQKASHFITVKKCDNLKCGFEKLREVPTPPDDRILLDLSTRRADCCDLTEKVEQVVGGIKAKMKFGNEPCYCECECKFGFMKKTTYCEICRGYEHFGEDFGRKPGYELPFPCPIFHKLNEKKMVGASGSDTKNKKEKQETEKELTKKGKKRKIDSRFQFNYGYTGIPPHIGHSRCALPCVGTLNTVPKRMGWLWNCENVPGMKYRPLWRPGASNKHVVRLLKIAKNPGEFLAKKRKKVLGKPKRPLKRPLLTVQKKDGEYTVTMETMRTFAKPRTFNQYPYEDKPLVTYTIGRTSEENLQRKIKKERAQRRLERLQRDFVQSAFRDMCQEICVKTYQQALGMLPDAEQPDCTCYPAQLSPDDVDLDHSCSCSEDKDLSESDTDSDEWVVEFTPPNATFDPTFKSKKLITTDNTTQYAFTDYKVKLLDRLGNPVPRFFKGPDGKQQCSDLGGFLGPDHKWLEINVDGFIGPDEKWVPHNFLGPNGEPVDGESGKFQAMDGKWLVIGVDGYIDQGKWKFYPKSRSPVAKKHKSGKKTAAEPKEDKRSEATWSCFGTVSPKLLSKMGIVGHGHDKKVLHSKLRDMLAQGEDVNIPQPKTVPRSNRPKGRLGADGTRTLAERTKCKHATPSVKGIVAVDGHGNKTYFRLKKYDNTRPKDRMTSLTDQGISVSSFHVPCFHSFISREIMKKQQYDRLVALAKRRAAGTTQKQANRGAQNTTTSKQADYTGVYVI